MKTPEQILQFMASRLGHIYFRPLMYGGTACAVDLLLHDYHELWGEIREEYERVEHISRTVHDEQDCGAMNFSSRYRTEHPNASEEDIVQFVVAHWKTISERVNIPIPYKELQETIAPKTRKRSSDITRKRAII